MSASNKWAKSPMGKLVDAIDRNSRGLAKLVSAQEHLFTQPDQFAWSVDFYSKILRGAMSALLKERKLFRAELEKALKLSQERKAAAPAEQREAGWNG